MTRNDQVWIPAINSITGLWEPMRQARRYTTVDKSHENKGKCQDVCDKYNVPRGYEKPTPLELIPDKTLKLK
jgi:hypothetical protein